MRTPEEIKSFKQDDVSPSMVDKAMKVIKSIKLYRMISYYNNSASEINIEEKEKKEPNSLIKIKSNCY